MDFNNFDKNDCTILIRATKVESLEVIKQVTDWLKGNDSLSSTLHTTDRQGYTALHHAVLLGDTHKLQHLLLHADDRCINRESYDRTTALLLACQSSHSVEQKTTLVQSLLSAGADPNIPEDDPFALPLHTVLESKWWEGARMMVEARASVHSKDFQHSEIPPIFLALDDLATVELLVHNGCMDTAYWSGDSVMVWLFVISDTNPIDNVTYTVQHMEYLCKALTSYGRSVVTTKAVLEAAQHVHIVCVQHMVSLMDPQDIDIATFLRLYKYCISWTRLKPLHKVEGFYRMLLEILFLRKCFSKNEVAIIFGMTNSVRLMKILLEECKNADVPVTSWLPRHRRLVKVAEWPHLAILMNGDSSKALYRRRHCGVVPCNAITPLIMVGLRRPETPQLLTLLIQEGVPVVEDTLYELLVHALPSDILPPGSDTSFSQCFKIILQNYRDRGIPLESGDFFSVCDKLYGATSVGLYLILREGVPGHKALDHIRSTDMSMMPCREKLLCAFVMDKFVSSLAAKPLLLRRCCPQRHTKPHFVSQLRASSTTPKNLKQLSRLAIRNSMGSLELRDKVAQLDTVVGRHLTQYLMYEGEFDVGMFSEKKLSRR